MIEVVDLGGFASAKTVHGTTPADPALAFYRTLADAKDFDRLTTFCAERLLLAPDDASDFRWRKDSAIARALQGRHVEALEILCGAERLTRRVGGRLLGRYQNEFGLVLARLGRSSLALERFNLAYQTSRSADDLLTCAQADHNRARALVTRGEQAKAMRYIKRALDYARANNDYRLEMEVCESLIEFGGTR